MPRLGPPAFLVNVSVDGETRRHALRKLSPTLQPYWPGVEVGVGHYPEKIHPAGLLGGHPALTVASETANVSLYSDVVSRVTWPADCKCKTGKAQSFKCFNCNPPFKERS